MLEFLRVSAALPGINISLQWLKSVSTSSLFLRRNSSIPSGNPSKLLLLGCCRACIRARTLLCCSSLY